MTVATVVTSTMPNVPVLSGTEGSLVALIRYIAPILGWEIMFDNGPVIVVRPQSYKGGQALLYRFDDRAARGGAAPIVAEVRAYESMSDINTGAGLVGPVFIHKSMTADTTRREYIVAGDAYGFFINSEGYGNYSGIMYGYYLGFNVQFIDTSIPVCVLFGSSVDGKASGSMLFRNAPPNSASKRGLYVHKDTKGSINVPVALYGGVLDLADCAIGSAYISPDWSVYKPLPAITAVAPVYHNDGYAFSIGGRLPAFSRQGSNTAGYLELFGFCDDDLFYSPKNQGCLLVSTVEEFRP